MHTCRYANTTHTPNKQTNLFRISCSGKFHGSAKTSQGRQVPCPYHLISTGYTPRDINRHTEQPPNSHTSLMLLLLASLPVPDRNVFTEAIDMPLKWQWGPRPDLQSARAEVPADSQCMPDMEVGQTSKKTWQSAKSWHYLQRTWRSSLGLGPGLRILTHILGNSGAYCQHDTKKSIVNLLFEKKCNYWIRNFLTLNLSIWLSPRSENYRKLLNFYF